MNSKILFFLLTIILNYSVYSTSTPNVAVKSYNIKSHLFSNKLNFIGRCINEQSRDIYARKAGTIDKITAKQGSILEQGETILSINENIAKSNLNYSKANLDNSLKNFKRIEALLEKKVVSFEQLELVKVDLEKARSSYNVALNEYNDLIITAPFKGEVGVIETMVGSNINVGDYLCSIINPGKMLVFVELPESLLGKISKTTQVNLKDSNDNVSNGKIVSVSSYLSNNGTMTIKIQSDSDNKLIHGSYINVEFIVDSHENLGVPEGIIMKNESGSFVYKIKNNIIKQEYIKLGYRNDNMVEILNSNLKMNDLIVLEGLTKISDGTKVELKD